MSAVGGETAIDILLSTFGAEETFAFSFGANQRLLDPHVGQQDSKHAGSTTDWQTGAAGRIFGGWKSIVPACLKSQ
jgi:hypothetical protein